MIRRRLIAVVTVGLTLAGLVQAETTTLRIQDYPGFGNFLVRVANANGLCEKNGIKCTLRTIPQAPLGMQTLLSGDLDVALTPPEVLIHAVNRGASLKVIGTGQSAPNFFLVATPDLKKASGGVGYPEVMQYFKGKKVGVTARGSAAEFQMISMLKGAGMKATDAVIVAVGSPDTALPAISQKQVDGLMTFAPLDGFCEVTKACSMVVDPRKGQGPAEIVDLSGAAIVSVVRADFAQKNPQTIHAFRRAMSEAEDFVQNPANFAAIMKVAQDTFKINGPDGDKVLEVSLRNTLPGYKFGLNPKAFQYSAEYMHRTGQIDKVIDTSKLLLIR